jgi:hypothetical protein
MKESKSPIGDLDSRTDLKLSFNCLIIRMIKN